MSDVLLYDLAESVATVTLNRPEAMNALDTELKVALRDALAAAAEDEDVRAVVLTGSGRAFCVGQDLAEHARNLETDLDAVWATVPEHYTPIATTLATMPKPVVAAVNGAAAGAGAAFSLACDFRVAADTAKLTMAFSAVGLDVSWDVELYGELLKVAGGKERMRAYFDEYGWPEGADSDEARDALIKELLGKRRELKIGTANDGGERPLPRVTWSSFLIHADVAVATGTAARWRTVDVHTTFGSTELVNHDPHEVAGPLTLTALLAQLNIDPRRVQKGGKTIWEVHINGGRVPTGLEAVAWARRVEELFVAGPDLDHTQLPDTLGAALTAVWVPNAFSGAAAGVALGLVVALVFAPRLDDRLYGM